MDIEATVSILAFATIFLIGVAVVIFFYFSGKNKGYNSCKIKNPKPRREGFEMGKEFYIYNYLNKSIRVEVSVQKKNGKYVEPFTLATIHPKKRKGFLMKDIEKYLIRGSRFRVYVYDQLRPGLGEKLFSTYEMEVPEGKTIKVLHVGMITSKWVGSDSDYTIGQPGLNAVQGLPWIKMHNMTDMPIALNNNINISANGTLRYSGRDAFGVRLGTIFKDQDGIFQDFIFTVPATDVYYGVTSDIQQPLFGGFQLSPLFDDDPDEPQYLLQEKWMGGPAYPKIPYGFLPIEGPQDLPYRDRWNQPVSEYNIKNPVGPPVELNPDTYPPSNP